MAISDGKYDKARDILIGAGSNTARASHRKHTQGGSPDDHGRQLLVEARDEFRRGDPGLDSLHSGMSQRHYAAIHSAADEMGIDRW